MALGCQKQRFARSLLICLQVLHRKMTKLAARPKPAPARSSVLLRVQIDPAAQSPASPGLFAVRA